MLSQVERRTKVFAVSWSLVNVDGIEGRIESSSRGCIGGVFWASRRVNECSRQFSRRVSLLLDSFECAESKYWSLSLDSG